MDRGAPKQDEVTRITNAVMEQMGECDLESALTVLCNILGQCVATLADGKPSAIQRHGDSIAENVKKAAIARMWADDEKRRQQD